MEFKKSFTTQKGSTVDFTVNCSAENATIDDKKELLSRFAETSRKIYLEIATELGKTDKNALPENKITPLKNSIVEECRNQGFTLNEYARLLESLRFVYDRRKMELYQSSNL